MNIVFSIVEEPMEMAADIIDTFVGNTIVGIPSIPVVKDDVKVDVDVESAKVELMEPQDVDIVRKLMRHGHSPHAGHGHGHGHSHGEVSLNAIDRILEKETNRNKTDSWNRLDKTIKLRKLNAYAEHYGREHGLSSKDVRSMQAFFIESLEKNKLQRTKEVIYNKDTHEIQSIPALHYNATNRHFTLRITDTKRVSTLKSLTPLKREKKEIVETIET